jgi:hypothetical protein
MFLPEDDHIAPRSRYWLRPRPGVAEGTEGWVKFPIAGPDGAAVVHWNFPLGTKEFWVDTGDDIRRDFRFEWGDPDVDALVVMIGYEPPRLSEASRLKSFNKPGLFIRHRNFRGELTARGADGGWGGPGMGGSGSRNADDFTFTVVDRGRSRVGLRSVNHPDHFLRHRNFEVRLDTPGAPHDPLWWQDSSFLLRPGMAHDAAASFQANYRLDLFLRHLDFKLYVQPVNNDLDREDATFWRRPL